MPDCTGSANDGDRAVCWIKAMVGASYFDSAHRRPGSEAVAAGQVHALRRAHGETSIRDDRAEAPQADHLSAALHSQIDRALNKIEGIIRRQADELGRQ